MWENRVVSVNPVELAVVAVHQVPSRRVVRAAAERIVWAVTVLPAEEVTARSAAEAPTSLAPAATEAVIAWAVEALVAVVAAAEVEEVAVEEVAVAEEVDAGDEQFKTRETEIKHHELIQNFFARLCDLYVRCGCVFIAGRAGS